MNRATAIKYFICTLYICFSCLPQQSKAQLDTSALWVNIDSISITATRITNKWVSSSQAIGQTSIANRLNFSQQLSLQDCIKDVSGVFSMNNQNMAQDLRISIRGFGARSAFGIRGIKLIVDGIPESTPDGQGQLDALPLGILKNIEIIKGPSSVLYGNASGGVISINTLSEFNHNLLTKPLLQARLSLGSFNTSQLQVTYGHKHGNTSYIFHANQVSSDGYRAYSEHLSRNLKTRVDHRFSKFSSMNFMLDFLSSPTAQDPGALNEMELVTDRTQARLRNLEFVSGESIDNLKSSISYQLKAAPNRTLDLYGFYSSRKFDGKLPFEIGGIVDLNRHYYGQGASYTIMTYKENYSGVFKYGYDLANQFDNRTRYSNLLGQQGPTDLLQKESYKTAGIYLINSLDFGNIDVSTGMRYDYNAIDLKDNLLFGEDDSGNKTFSKFSYHGGINYQIDASSAIFANYSTGFETPTLLELTNDPARLQGINELLEPQTSKSIEVGFKLDVPDKFKCQLTVFSIDTENELVPFQVDTFPDRTFYRNAGSTTRRGLELEGNYFLSEQISLSGAYTFASYKYERFERSNIDYSGNYLPGLPRHNALFSLNYLSPIGLTIQSETQFVGALYLQDANSSEVPSYLLSNIYFSYNSQIKGYSLKPFLGLKNITSAEYNDNIRINGFGGRYYEPGPGFNFFVGFTLDL